VSHAVTTIKGAARRRRGPAALNAQQSWAPEPWQPWIGAAVAPQFS